MLYEFKKNDVFKNVVVANPRINFRINNTDIYYNNMQLTRDVKDGYAHIYDLNLNGLCDAGALDFSCEDPSAYIAII
jgi:hypothetical protein